jgi:hypothetical protein
MNNGNGFSKLQSEKDLENNKKLGPNSSTHRAAAIPFDLNKQTKRNYLSWDERFKELVDFKKINGQTNVPHQASRSLNIWVSTQRTQYRLWKEGKTSQFTSYRQYSLESIGFEFKLLTPWDQRFQELVEFKKTHGHTYVIQRSGPLGLWVATQREAFCRLKQGKYSPMTVARREKMESIGFVF